MRLMALLSSGDRRFRRVTIDKSRAPVVRYQLTRPTIDALVRGTRSAARIFFAAGARAVHAPSAPDAPGQGAPREPRPAHLDPLFQARQQQRQRPPMMGGCRMGHGPADSVTDSEGCVHGRRGLFVADASLFPTALEANPYLTVMALADRVADAVINRIGN